MTEQAKQTGIVVVVAGVITALVNGGFIAMNPASASPVDKEFVAMTIKISEQEIKAQIAEVERELEQANRETRRDLEQRIRAVEQRLPSE